MTAVGKQQVNESRHTDVPGARNGGMQTGWPPDVRLLLVVRGGAACDL